MPGMHTQGLLLPVATLCWRELVRFYRQPSRVVGALGTPVVFWLLIGSGIGTSLQGPGTPYPSGYLEYFFPGALLLIVLFTSIFCMMSTIEDRHEGFLQSVLVAPIPRSSLVLGKVLGGAVLAVAQALILLLFAPLVGIAMGPRPILLVAAALFLIALAVSCLGFAVAWKLDSVQGFHAVVNLFLIPMWMLSGALFPPSGASPWIRWLMKVNPLSYAMTILRRTLYWPAQAPGSEFASSNVSLTVVAVFAVLTLACAITLARRPITRPPL